MKVYFNTLLDLLFPARCISCFEVVSAPGSICAECWQEMVFVNQPCCMKCGMPFEYDIGIDVMCLKCEEEQTQYKSSLFLFKYNAISKKIIYKFKYYDHTYLAKYLASLSCRLLIPELTFCEILIPVPLHRHRLMSRFYNQSALLGKEIAKLMHIEFCSNVLQKTRHTIPQAALSKLQRQSNIKNSFSVNEGKQHIIANKNILLVDDVVTTGSTINECSKVLKNAGCKDVFVYSLAKVFH